MGPSVTKAPFGIESVKTTSMETVRTEVLDKNKDYYLRSKDKTEKHTMCQDISDCICQNAWWWHSTGGGRLIKT